MITAPSSYAQTPPRGIPASRSTPRPFLKWVGGKGQLLKQYWHLFPKKFNRYHEPFVGGGAVFFALRPKYVSLSDSNAELINCYTMIRDQLDDVIQALGVHRYERLYYYSVRAQDPNQLSAPEAAARMIFLNRTGFNGLYRLNKSGKFNVPFGRYTNPTICDELNLREASKILQGTKITQRSYLNVLNDVWKGDFVYFDPPYHPRSKTSNFTAYSRMGFHEQDQIQLAELFRKLSEIGVKAMLSNSDTPLIHELYSDFTIHEVRAGRSINSKAGNRGKISELVILNYTP